MSGNIEVVSMVHGSKLYGLDTEESDTDYKTVVLPTKEQVLLQRAVFHNQSNTSGNIKNNNEDIDTDTISLPKFIKLLCEGETSFIEMLHCDDPLTSHPIWEGLRSKRSMFYTSNMKAFSGYAKAQAYKHIVKGSRLKSIEIVLNIFKDAINKDVYIADDKVLLQKIYNLLPEHRDSLKVLNGFHKGDKFIDRNIIELCGSKYDFQTSIRIVTKQIQEKYDAYGHRVKQSLSNNGLDWKAISHALRVSFQLKEIYETGDLKFPLRDREFLLNVKQGKLDFNNEVSNVLEELIDTIEHLASTVDLPKKCDTDYWDKWLISVYHKYLNL